MFKKHVQYYVRTSMKKNAKCWVSVKNWERVLNEETVLESVLNIENAGDKVLNDVKVW